MVCVVSSICVVSGACFACVAFKRPRYQAAFERLGGGLMVTGLGLLGAGLGIHS